MVHDPAFGLRDLRREGGLIYAAFAGLVAARLEIQG